MEDLKSMVVDSLKEKGTLGKLKAELRASVFFALDQRGYAAPSDPARQPPSTNPKLVEFSRSKNGRLVIDIVREFLQFFELGFTESVFVPESNLDGVPFAGRDKLQGVIPGGDGAKAQHQPLLASLLEACLEKEHEAFVDLSAGGGGSGNRPKTAVSSSPSSTRLRNVPGVTQNNNNNHNSSNIRGSGIDSNTKNNNNNNIITNHNHKSDSSSSLPPPQQKPSHPQPASPDDLHKVQMKQVLETKERLQDAEVDLPDSPSALLEDSLDERDGGTTPIQSDSESIKSKTNDDHDDEDGSYGGYTPVESEEEDGNSQLSNRDGGDDDDDDDYTEISENISDDISEDLEGSFEGATSDHSINSGQSSVDFDFFEKIQNS